jgi:hypothetical protein
MPLNHARVIVDCVSLLAAYSQKAANTNSGPFLANLAILQIPYQDLFNLADGIVMRLNQTGEVPGRCARRS